MPRLFLCEKPSQARDIALVLGATQRQEGHLSGSGILVTWAFGHLLALAKLLKQVDEVVIATDADREGEAIAREILERERWQGEVSGYPECKHSESCD